MHGPPASTRRTIGAALYGDLSFDSRVRREAAALALAGFNVVLVCLAGAETAGDLPPGVRVIAHQPTRTRVLPRTPTPGASTTGRVRRVAGGCGGCVTTPRT